jgi:GH24 family phage-related lysozyme (muramidase)
LPREGYAGKAYWPAGQSGVTLDPGIDLGYAAAALVEQLYTPILSAEQLAAVQSVYGMKGEAAKAALDSNATLQGIRISRAQSDEIFPYAAEPYWNAIVKRFPTLANADTPGSVQTALLSLAYNRGAGNRGLRVLGQPLEDKNWAEIADLIGNMQQDHQLQGIRRRRRMEADLIRQELGVA